jgi:hypothetical protein
MTSISLNAQHNIEGIWSTGQDQTNIKIMGTIGKIHSSHNEKALVGKIIIKELKKKDNTYTGKIYLVRRNRWVDAVFVPNGNVLTLSILAGWQSKTLKWNLVKSGNH